MVKLTKGYFFSRKKRKWKKAQHVSKKIHFLNRESILTNFFFRKTKIFFHFLLVSLSVYNIRKYCLYLKMAKLNDKNQKKTKKSKFGRIDSKITLRVKQTKLLFLYIWSQSHFSQQCHLNQLSASIFQSRRQSYKVHFILQKKL